MRRELREDLLVTIGNFDGVHHGHRLLLKTVREKAQENGWFSLVVTFREHPSGFLRQESPLLLTTMEERCAVFGSLGIDGCLALDFTHDLARLTPEEFLYLLQEWGTRGIIVGHDFRFGAGATGGTGDILDFCRNHGLLGEVISPVKVGREIVSSSRIRELLQAGDLAKANLMLDRPYKIAGRVTHGAHRGRQLGFPTANLDVPANRLLPGYGVYLVRVSFDDRIHFGLANVGVRPTFSSNRPETEIYLLDTTGDFYNNTMDVEFLAYIRREQKFPSAAALVGQMKKDEQAARRLLQRHSCFNKQTLSG